MSGATPAGSGNFLVGQKCTATVSLPPFVYGTTLTYQWKVSGITFQSWSVVSDGNNQSHTVEVDGYGDPTQSTISWYWNDPSSKSETVSCTVTATAPAGQTNTSNGGSGTKSASVQVPGFTFTATPGYMQINTNCPNQNGALCFYAGPSSGQDGGINWKATSTTPAPFSPGTVELVQIATPNLSYTIYTGTGTPGATHNDPQNGHTGLDGQCPYPGSPENEAATPPVPFTSNDSPYAALSKTIGSITMTHQFTDYLMYLAPGSSQVVPLATLTWNTNGEATVPSTDNWADYAKQNNSDAAVAVDPKKVTVYATASVAGNAFPSWTLVNGPISISNF